MVGLKFPRLKPNTCSSSISKRGALTRGLQARRLPGLIHVARRCHPEAPGVRFLGCINQGRVLP